MKKVFLGVAILSLSVMMLTGCGKKETEKVKKISGEQTEKIILGVMPSTDNIPFILAHQQGFDKKNGVEIELEVFKSANDRDAALQAGKLDGVISDLAAMAIYQQGGLDIKIAARPYDEFTLVTGDDSVQKVADLKGKDVVFSKNTGTGYAVAMMLKDAGLSMADIKVSEVPQVPTRLELISNQKAAAAILPEPFVTMGKAQGLRVVESTNNIGINPFMIAFTGEALEEKATAIQGMFKAYDEGVDYIKNNDKSEYIQAFIDEVGFPASLKDQLEIPNYEKLTQVKEADVESAFAWAQDNGLLKKDLKYKDVVSDVYFK